MNKQYEFNLLCDILQASKIYIITPSISLLVSDLLTRHQLNRNAKELIIVKDSAIQVNLEYGYNPTKIVYSNELSGNTIEDIIDFEVMKLQEYYTKKKSCNISCNIL